LGLVLCGWFAVAITHTQTPSSTLTTPLIVDPSAPSAAESADLANIAQVFANEPPSAEVSTPSPSEADALVNLLAAGSTGGTGSDASAGGGGGAASTDTGSSDTGSSSQPSQDAIETEIKLLNSLVEHGKAIAAALPAKEQRLQELAAQLNAAKAGDMAKGAQSQLESQQLLLKEIQLKEVALNTKLNDLKTTEAKLSASVDKLQKAVNTNSQVTQALNTEAAVASVGDTSTGGAPATSGAAGAAAVQPASFLDDDSIRALLRRVNRL